MARGSTPGLPPEVVSAFVETADQAGMNIVITTLTAEENPKVVFASPGLLGRLGYTFEEYTAVPAWQHIAPESRPVAADQRTRRLAGEALSRRFELLLLTKAGSRIPFEVTTSYMPIGGEPSSVTLLYDVSERRATEEKLIQADRLAAVGTLAAGIAHEINNPLAYVLLGLQYLEREIPKLCGDAERMREAQSRMEDVRSGAERVGTIVRDLKTFARADEVARGPVDVREAMDAALKIADNEIRHRARLSRRYADAPPVDANAARLEQVFLNLVVNAAHAVSDKPLPEAEVRVSVEGLPGGEVVAEVADNGHGIPESVMPRIFDPFFTTKPIGVGTGLGLPICKSIVEGFGGTIAIISESGAGTRVRVVLPPYVSTVARLPSEVPARVPSTPPASRKRLLIVDDEPAIGTMLTRSLSHQYEVVVATSGNQALETLFVDAFDVILCDVMMPGMTGMDLYVAVRERDPNMAERMVFMTGGAFIAHVADFLGSIDNPKLEKPFDWNLVSRTLRLVAEGAPS